MRGGCGGGLLSLRKKWLPHPRLPFAGWQSAVNPMAMDNRVGAKVTQERGGRVLVARGCRLRTDAAALEAGNTAYAPMLGFGAALELHQQLGIAATAAPNRRLQP